MQANATTRVRAGSSTRTFGSTFPGEFWFYFFVLNVFAISHVYARLYVLFWEFSILTFLWDFHWVRGHITFEFYILSECLISFAASDVISVLWSRISNLLSTLPGEMRWLKPFKTRCFTWIQVIRSQFIQRIQLSRMRFVNSVSFIVTHFGGFICFKASRVGV